MGGAPAVETQVRVALEGEKGGGRKREKGCPKSYQEKQVEGWKKASATPTPRCVPELGPCIVAAMMSVSVIPETATALTHTQSLPDNVSSLLVVVKTAC